LAWYASFRLGLAALLLLSALPPFAGSLPGAPPSPLALMVTLAYAILALAGLLVTHLRWLDKAQLAQTGLYVDIIAFTLLLHASGGVNSGFGLLLAIAVAAGSLLMEGRLSLLFAAFATLGVMAEQTYAQLYAGGEPGGFTRAGLLGLTYFTVAVLAHVLYRRIRESEHLAASRQVDIADLSKLNELIIQRMATGVLVLDERQRVRLMNNAAAHLLGATPDAGQPALEEITPALSAWVAEQRSRRPKTTATDSVTVRERDLEPSYLALGDRASSPGLVFLRDKRAVVQEAQQIKLASLGRLTASIAHNIRNPLSAVKHAGQLLAESPRVGEGDLRLLAIIARNTGRIDEIVESVLQLSKRDQAAPQALDLGPWLREFAADLRESRRLVAERIATEIAADTPRVEVDPRHLHQILANLCDNAIQHAGTPERPAKLRLRAGRRATDGVTFVEVCDDGPVIDQETAREMFNPFFTTSVTGTGLGLYIALELSEANGIELGHFPGQHGGNCFLLAFPLS
jgi:two-component system sensor histidine kinase PilS (NtrC family)